MTASAGYAVLIDGYNVLLRHEPWQRLPLEAARRRFLILLQSVRWPYPVDRVTVVFDSREPDAGGTHSAGMLRVRFASPSADAEILEAIRTSHTPRRLLVISDDGELVRSARSHGALHHTVRWLMDRARPTSRPQAGHRATEPGRPSLPAADARRITEELERRWLDNG